MLYNNDLFEFESIVKNNKKTKIRIKNGNKNGNKKNDDEND